MRILAFCFLFIFATVNSLAFASEKSKDVLKEEVVIDEDWTSALSTDFSYMTFELRTVNQSSSREEIKDILQEALTKVQEIKDKADRYGIIVKGFSVNIGFFIPSITIDFEFKD